MSGRILPWFAVLTVLLFAIGLPWALVIAPEDYQQGNSVRIMYIHVPAAILAQSSYFMMAMAGAIFLIWRVKIADVAMASAAPIGASLTLLAILSGAIWGKPTWGTYWVWDARLTSTLVLLFLFFGVMLLRSAMSERAGAGRACAVLALVGVVNIPIIKYSVDWWFTLHQPSTFTLTEKPAMPSEMYLPLVVMLFAYYSFFLLVWLMQMRAEVIAREARSDWVQKLVTSQ
ncbi:MAG: heme ABC transporter permease [Pseudomonadales bacterium]|nr:heme ABC transporter permease [Pseudomonadales bacterium]